MVGFVHLPIFIGKMLFEESYRTGSSALESNYLIDVVKYALWA